ncbi:NUDIX hydrolase [Actinoplanes subglobosus]|uniref:NUDIX domain-containing protein n=1 Tax=Actinoplanes subglobosus TaxID=1547892 RepID=A0ABV8IX03_9ACTN
MRTLVFVVAGDRVLLIRYRDRNGAATGEKSDRAGFYNGIGGHVEKGEDILDSAAREAMEEAGISLENPRLAGVVHVDGFAGKQIVNFVVTASTNDTPKAECDEGRLEWVEMSRLPDLPVFADVKPLLERALTDSPTFTAIARFDGFELVTLHLR